MPDDDDLQSLVDDLAGSLHRSVAIDDPSIRLLAASRHFGDEDSLRVTSILNRAVDPEIVRGVIDQGISSWTKPGRVVVSAGHDRTCVPVRCNELLLGYLWLIENETEPLDDAGLEAAERVAERAGVLLYRRLLLRERSRARHESLLRELVSSDPAVRAQAIDDLRAEQLFGDEVALYQVVAVQREGLAAPSPSYDVAVESALEDGRRALGEESTLVVANRSRAWMLITSREPLADNKIQAAIERVLGRYRSLTGSSSRLVVGLDNPVGQVTEVVESQRQAFHACRAALLSPRLGDTARWGRLGVAGFLLSISVQEVSGSIRLPALEVLRNNESNLQLLDTLRAFLDNAGDVRRAADQLCVHRATLYNRLRKVEQLTGQSLDDGEDRLLLHLAIKLGDLNEAINAQPGSAS